MNRKRFWKGIVTAFLLLCVGQTVYASEQAAAEVIRADVQETQKPDNSGKTEEDDGSEEEESGDYTGSLRIDNAHVYKNMDKSYEDGYVPEIKGDTAVVVLPLYCEKDSPEIASVTASPGLGEPESSPFIFKNYQKTFFAEPREDEGKLFLIQFRLKMHKTRAEGTYPVSIQVDYTADKTEGSQEFVVYVQIEEKEEKREEEPSGRQQVVEVIKKAKDNAAAASGDGESKKKETPVPDPKVLLSRCEDFPEDIFSGDEVAFTAVLKNTNRQKYVQNMVVSFNCESEGISIAEESSECYVEKMEAQGEKKLPVRLKISDSTPAGKYVVTVEMSYDNPDASPLTSSGKIQLHVKQKVKVGLEVASFTSEVNAGDTVKIPVQVLNLGRGKIYNVRCTMEVPGFLSDKSLFLGNMEGGNAVSGEISAFAKAVNEEAENDKDRYGKTSGVVKVTYETEDGKEYSETKKFSASIHALEIRSTSSKKDEEKEKKVVQTQMAAGVGILLAVAVVGVVLSVVVQKRKKWSYEK